MTIAKNSIPSRFKLASEQEMIRTSSYLAHESIAGSFDGINLLYGESSVSEDIILTRFLNFYANAGSVTSEESRKDVVVGSFLSQDMMDTSFPVDKQLNIDTQNGDLTLPIKNTNTLKVNGIIIENDSNGSLGDSLNNKANNDINVITVQSSASLFIYEKVVNSLALTPLQLAITMKLDEEEFANGIYIKMYADNGTSYPAIEELETSLDGLTWHKTELSSMINKADYYIRFEPLLCRYVRVRFKQSTYSSIGTSFGTRYRYLIGLREVSIKQTEYEDKGEFVSIPMAGKKNISKIFFSSKGKGEILYMLSANNGSKWVKLANNSLMLLYNSELGLKEDTDIESIRVKILMDKITQALKQNINTEYHIINDLASYYLQYNPLKVNSMSIGGHISIGELVSYNIQIKDLVQLSKNIFDTSDVIAKIQLPYIPYYAGIENDIVVKIDGIKLNNLRSIWKLMPHESKHSSMFGIVSQDLAAINGVLSISFKPLSYQGASPIVPLIRKPFFESQESFNVYAGTKLLNKTDYYINETKDLVINDSAFNPATTYSISYMPLVDVSDQIPSQLNANEVQVQNIKPFTDAKIRIDYSYSDDTSSSSSLKYYTPICNEYRIEII